jgi:predicted Na+-dependent transporter
MMDELIRYTIWVFSITTLGAMGLGVTIDEIAAPLRNRRAFLLALAANFVLVPMIALVVVTVFQNIASDGGLLTEPQKVALVLLAVAAGAHLGPSLVQAAKGNAALAVGLMVIFSALAVVVVPAELALLLPEFRDKSGMILGLLAASQLAPLAVGIAIRVRYATIAGMLRPVTVQVSNLSLAVLVVSLVQQRNWAPPSLFGWLSSKPLEWLQTPAKLLEDVAAFIGDVWAMIQSVFPDSLALLTVIAGALVVGYFLGAPDFRAKRALALSTALRNLPVVLIIALEAGDGAALAGFVAVVALFYGVGLLVSTVVAGEWGRQPETAAVTTAAAPPPGQPVLT